MQKIQSGFLKLALAASILFGASLAVTPAMATDVTFHFTGIVDNSPIAFGSNVLTGSFTFNSATPNSTAASTQFGTYSNSISNLTFTIGSYTSTTNGSPITNSSIVVLNDYFQFDAFQMSTPVSDDLTLHPLTYEMNLLLSNNVAQAFPNTSLPTHTFTDPPGLGTSIANYFIGTPGNPLTPFRIAFDNGTNPDLIANGRITALTLVATPLPPAVILFGAGLVALIGLGARNRWKQGSNIA